MDCLEKAQQILAELVAKHYGADQPVLRATPRLLPSCGLMGDDRIYGYAWELMGIPNFDASEARALLREAATRLTNEVIHDDGTRFVRVFAEVEQAEQ